MQNFQSRIKHGAATTCSITDKDGLTHQFTGKLLLFIPFVVVCSHSCMENYDLRGAPQTDQNYDNNFPGNKAQSFIQAFESRKLRELFHFLAIVWCKHPSRLPPLTFALPLITLDFTHTEANQSSARRIFFCLYYTVGIPSWLYVCKHIVHVCLVSVVKFFFICSVYRCFLLPPHCQQAYFTIDSSYMAPASSLPRFLLIKPQNSLLSPKYNAYLLHVPTYLQGFGPCKLCRAPKILSESAGFQGGSLLIFLI